MLVDFRQWSLTEVQGSIGLDSEVVLFFSSWKTRITKTITGLITSYSHVF